MSQLVFAILEQTLQRMITRHISVFIFLIVLVKNVSYGQKSSFDINDWRILYEDSITDIDGNNYSQQRLGEHVLLVENLKVKRFNNGDTIVNLMDSLLWITTDKPAFCNVIGITWYIDNDGRKPKETLTNELFYNSYVVSDQRNVCPLGWHIPTIREWQQIEHWVDSCNWIFYDHFYGSTSVGPPHLSPWGLNLNFDGLSFSNQPFGYRIGETSDFTNYQDFGYWWSKETTINAEAWARILFDRGFGVDDIHLEYDFPRTNRNTGMSIKCVKDSL